MNPEKPSREEIEAKLTALLLGELPAEEAQLLRWAISQDAELKKLHDRLQLTAGFVREAAKNPAETILAQTAPLKLSDERREKLLAHFKTIAPREFVPLVPPLKKQREISPLLAMAAAIALIALLAAMLLPVLSAAKRKAQNISAVNQAKIKELDARLAFDENTPVTSATAAQSEIESDKTDLALPKTSSAPLPIPPTVASEQRLKSVEALVQNGNPTASGADAWKNQTQIVLPASGTDDKELAAASSAPPNENVGYGLTGDRFGGGGGASANFQWGAQSIIQRAQPEASGRFFSSGLTKDDVSGARDLFETGQSSVAQNQADGKLSETTLSGYASVDARSTSIAPDFDADKKSKVPMLGDLPVMGALFKSSAANQDGKIAADTAAPFSVIGDIGAPKNLGEGYGRNASVAVNGETLAFQDNISDDLSKSGNDSAILSRNKSYNAYNGVTTLGGGTFNVPASAANPLGQFPSSTTVDNGSLALNVAKDGGNGSLGYVDSSQIERNRRIDQFGVAAPAKTETRAPIPNAEINFPATNSVAFNVHADKFYRGLVSDAPATTVSPLPSSPVGAAQQQAEREKDFAGGAVEPTALNYATSSPVAASATKELADEDRLIQKTPSPALIPTPEILTRENNFSTFSLNVSDVSFKLAAASLERGQLPDAASIRSEEFINAFNYHDPEPAAGVPVAFVAERARYPFAQNRDLLRFSLKTAAAGREAGRPLNLVLLLDNSGSMERADRVAIIHDALKVLAAQLQPQDTLSIVTFARTARLWVDGARGDQAGTAVNKVSGLTPEGGTNLEEAMNLAYATARRHYLANGGNRVVLLTDGAANLGNVNPEALKQKVESFRKQGIALDCFGIGWEGYNDDLLEVLSSNGDGRYGFINTPEAATTEFAAQLAGALHVAAEDVKVQVEFNPQRVISYRQIGYAKHQLTKEQFRDNTVAAAPMAAREAGNALYTVEVNPQGSGPIATVRVRFRIPGTQEVSEHEWAVPFDGSAPALEKSSPALRLAATASAFSEWLASSPFAQEVTTDQLLNYLNGVPAIYGADARPRQLETMLREAKSLSGK